MTLSSTIPPHDEQAETSVLGSVLLEGNLKFLKLDLSPEAFYFERHRIIWRAMQSLDVAATPVDLVTLTAQLNREGRLDAAGGMTCLIGLSELVPTSAHAEHYLSILNEYHYLRRALSHMHEVQRRIHARDLPLEDIVQLMDHPPTFEAGEMDLVSIGAVAAVVRTETRTGSGAEGLTTGLRDLDRAVNGLEPGRLYVVAARPGVGKSALAFQIGLQAAKATGRVLGFSLEMSTHEITARLLASEARVGLERLNRSRRTNGERLSERDMERVEQATRQLQAAPLELLLRPGLTLSQLMEQVRRAHHRTPLSLFILDYIQLVQVGEGRRIENATQRVTEVTMALKTLALELNIPVLALSQMSRAVENRPGHTPQLSDLRDSGSVEQDADVVMFIHREHAPAPGHENLVELIIAKNRSGQLCKINLVFQGEFVRFAGRSYEDPQAGLLP